MSEWQELNCIQDDLSTKLSYSSTVPLSCLQFDSEEELLWTGNAAGWLCSYYGLQLQKYTSFRGHHDSPVLQIACTKNLLISLSSIGIRASTRQGMFRWHIKDSAVKGATCMLQHPRSPHDFILAGLQRGSAIINVEKGTITEIFDNDWSRVVIMKSHGRVIISGTSHGEIRIHDAMDAHCRMIHRVQAFTATLIDLVLCGGSILACGYHNRYGEYSIESMVKVFDARYLRPLLPIAFSEGPAFIRSHPKMTSSAMLVSQSAQMQTIDVGNTVDIRLQQLNTMNYITHFDLSPSGDLFAYIDMDNNIHLYSAAQSQEPRFTDFSKQTAFSDYIATRPISALLDDLPLHTIGLPYYKEELLSSWPATMIFEVGKIPPKIDADILANLKIIDGIGYAPFHKRRRRNLVEDRYSGGSYETPRFRSERFKAIAAGETTAELVHDLTEDLGKTVLGALNIPSYYRRMEIKYSKFGIEDFDFEFFNHTNFAGLETTFANSYCNAVLQLHNFSIALHRAAQTHAAAGCLQEKCLFCELGYLFGMLAIANGQNCQASNFQQSFSAHKDAINLGLVLPDAISQPAVPWANLSQSFNRFLLETIVRDSINSRMKDEESHARGSELDSVIGIFSKVISRCSCGFEAVKPAMTVVTDLTYIKPVLSRKDNQSLQFASALKTSIHREGSVRDWCQACRQFQPATVRRMIQSLPAVLVINAMVQNAEQWRNWGGKQWPPIKLGIILVNGKVQVLQGRDLEKRGADKSVVQYVLRGLVCEIKYVQQEAHMVTFVRINESGEIKWLLFNDFLVRMISEDEALSFSGTWKMPAILTYDRVVDTTGPSVVMSRLDSSILYSNLTLSKHSARCDDFLPLGKNEALSRNTLIAIDAEFVALQEEEIEIRSDGTRDTIQPRRLSLARVSVLRGDGEHFGAPFIDDYIETTQPIADYLTDFSGIHPGDLDSETSKHYIVPHKYAYKKLHVLAKLGCKFIGHGLKSDFRIINLVLPKEQIIDTVDLFYLPERQRKLSLKYLAWFYLNQEIQSAEHDSIEDARTALLLYQKYLEFEAAGEVEMRLKELYDEGRAHNFKPPGTS